MRQGELSSLTLFENQKKKIRDQKITKKFSIYKKKQTNSHKTTKDTKTLMEGSDKPFPAIFPHKEEPEDYEWNKERCPLCHNSIPMEEFLIHLAKCLFSKFIKLGVVPPCFCAGCQCSRSHPGNYIANGKLYTNQQELEEEDEFPHKKRKFGFHQNLCNESSSSASVGRRTESLNFGVEEERNKEIWELEFAKFLSQNPPEKGKGKDSTHPFPETTTTLLDKKTQDKGEKEITTATTLFEKETEHDDSAEIDLDFDRPSKNGETCPFTACHKPTHPKFGKVKKPSKDLPIMHIAGMKIGLCKKAHLSHNAAQNLLKGIKWLEKERITEDEKKVTKVRADACSGFAKGQSCEKEGFETIYHCTYEQNKKKIEKFFCTPEHMLNFVANEFGKKGQPRKDVEG